MTSTDAPGTVLVAAACSSSSTEVAPVPGFIESRFNPLVYDCVRNCVPAGDADDGETAILLGSVLGDTTTADVASRKLVSGDVVNALLFYQSVPTSILGHVARELVIKGPMYSIASNDAVCCDLLETAELILEDDDVSRVVVVYVELAADERTREVYGALGRSAPDVDTAACVVVGRPGRRDDGNASAVVVGMERDATGHAIEGAPFKGMPGLCRAFDELRRARPRARRRVVDESPAGDAVVTLEGRRAGDDTTRHGGRR